MQQVAGGPMSHRSQIVYLSIVKKRGGNLSKAFSFGEGGSTERLAEVETDEVFVTQTNFASLRREVARVLRVTEGVACTKD